MKDARMIRRHWLRITGGCCLAAMVALTGCGSEEIENPLDEMDEDQQAVAALVGQVSDYAAQGQKSLRSIFTRDGAPSSGDVKKYKARYFELDGDVTVSGDSATFPVKVGQYKSPGTAVAQWKATKVDGNWKLADAPLP